VQGHCSRWRRPAPPAKPVARVERAAHFVEGQQPAKAGEARCSRGNSIHVITTGRHRTPGYGSRAEDEPAETPTAPPTNCAWTTCHITCAMAWSWILRPWRKGALGVIPNPLGCTRIPRGRARKIRFRDLCTLRPQSYQSPGKNLDPTTKEKCTISSRTCCHARSE